MKEILKNHALKGRKQTPEHIEKRVKATAKTRASWTQEKRSKVRLKISLNSRMRDDPDVRKKCSESIKEGFRNGRVAWHKGNNWRDKYTKEELRAIATKRARNLRAGNHKLKLSERMSAMIYHAIKGNKAGRQWESLVGYTLKDLISHLENHFADGMSWENMGDWHIDHKLPRRVFNYNNPEDIDFLKCWSLDNLQPLWKKDNLKKHGKLKQDFQPSFAF